MTSTQRPNPLESVLKDIITAHSEATVHPSTKSGPYAQDVLWTSCDGQVLGKALWDSTTGWQVRAIDARTPLRTRAVRTVRCPEQISQAITEVIHELQRPRPLVFTDTTGPELHELKS